MTDEKPRKGKTAAEFFRDRDSFPPARESRPTDADSVDLPDETREKVRRVQRRPVPWVESGSEDL